MEIIGLVIFLVSAASAIGYAKYKDKQKAEEKANQPKVVLPKLTAAQLKAIDASLKDIDLSGLKDFNVFDIKLSPEAIAQIKTHQSK